jgi:predicted porin
LALGKPKAPVQTLENLEMKKTLVALAALASVSAFAQSSVTIYGTLDTGYYQYKSSGVADIKEAAVGNLNSANGSGYLNGSRLGFKGMEDLGGGLNAEFQLEYGINMTTASDLAATPSASGTGVGDAATIANMRLGTVALNGGFGQVKIGTQYSYIDPASGSAATQQANPAGGTNAAQGAASLLKFNESSIARATNSISYTTPNISGFTAQFLFNPSETAQADTPATFIDKRNAGVEATKKVEERTEFALNYAQGPLKAGYASLTVKDYAAYNTLGGVKINNVGVQNDIALNMSSGSVTATAKLDYTATGASYDFGSFKLSGTNTTFKAVDASNTVKSNQTGFAVSVPVGKWNIGGGYTSGTLSNATADVFNTKGIDLLAVYDLSKRTNVYGVYGVTKYDTAGAVAPGNATGNLNTDKSIQQSAIGVGLRHSF